MESMAAKGYQNFGKSTKQGHQTSASNKKLIYEERFEALGLYPLHQRRLRGDLIEVFKLLNGLEQVDYSTFVSLAEDTKTRGHSLKLFKLTLVKNLNCRSQVAHH